MGVWVMAGAGDILGGCFSGPLWKFSLVFFDWYLFVMGGLGYDEGFCLKVLAGSLDSMF